MQELFPVFTGGFGLLRLSFIKSFIHQKKEEENLCLNYFADNFLAITKRRLYIILLLNLLF
jgi:hypothetical protein